MQAFHTVSSLAIVAAQGWGTRVRSLVVSSDGCRVVPSFTLSQDDDRPAVADLSKKLQAGQVQAKPIRAMMLG